MIDIDKKIIESVKSHNGVHTKVFREIKAAKLKFITAKNATVYDELAEVSLIKKLISEHEEALLNFTLANRVELMNEENDILNVLKTLIPAEPSLEEIGQKLYEFAQAENNVVDNIIAIPKNAMGKYIKGLKQAFPSADGKKISEIVKSFLV